MTQKKFKNYVMVAQPDYHLIDDAIIFFDTRDCFNDNQV